MTHDKGFVCLNKQTKPLKTLKIKDQIFTIKAQPVLQSLFHQNKPKKPWTLVHLEEELWKKVRPKSCSLALSKHLSIKAQPST